MKFIFESDNYFEKRYKDIVKKIAQYAKKRYGTPETEEEYDEIRDRLDSDINRFTYSNNIIDTIDDSDVEFLMDESDVNSVRYKDSFGGGSYEFWYDLSYDVMKELSPNIYNW